MKNILLFLIIMISLVAASCVKDRIQPAAAPYIQPQGSVLMTYWDFNNQDSSKRAATYSVNTGAIFNYYCAYIDYTTGTKINLQRTSDSGQCLRVRNPSDSVIFHMPTTGYDSITVAFAEESSSSGPSSNAIFYTVDGVHFISTVLGNNSYAVTTSFQLYKFSFVADPNVKNNPKFAIKIVMLNNNTGTSGNDRIDNVSMSGVKD